MLVGVVAVRAAAEPPRAPILEKAIRERRTRVPEFRYIREQARRLGVRVWLFGGSASAFSHYVLRDLEGGTGDRGSAAEEFSYRYSRIFRVRQDVDLVVDGPESAARLLEANVSRRFPHLLGNKKSAWEVRLLREDLGDKEAPLTNENFRQQHTDSHSTGMVELTEPPPGETVVRDVRDWSAGPGQFLDDVVDRRLRFYFSPTHESTKRASEGLNPAIFAVVRYFTKAFQYGLETRPEDEPWLRAIIERFDRSRDLSTPYAIRWLEHHGKKLFLHATNVEWAWNELERIGLRRALVAGDGPHPAGTLAWLLTKEPLRSHPIGHFAGPDDPRRLMAGDHPIGHTARQLGIDYVAHDTQDYLLYETILASWDGHPNATISRRNVEGESAAAGPALYGRLGSVGGKNTHITVHMRLHPDARDGVDFVLDGTPHDGAPIRLFNKVALTIAREKLDWDIGEYLSFVRGGGTFGEGDGGVLHRIRMELRHTVDTMAATQRRKLLAEATSALSERDVPVTYLTEVASIFGRHLGKEARRRMFERARTDLSFAEVFLREVWGAIPESEVAVEELDGLSALLRVHGAALFAAIADMLATDGWSEPKLWEVAYSMVLRAAQREPSEALIRQMWLREPWVDREDALPRLVQALEITHAVTAETIANIGVHEEWARHPQAELLVRSLAERTTRSSAEMFRIVLDSDAWSPVAKESVRAKVTREIAWAEFHQGTIRLERAWHDPIFQRELREAWEDWRLGNSREGRESYRTFVQSGLGQAGLRQRGDYLAWVDEVLDDAEQGRLDGLTRMALLGRFFADPLVSDVDGMLSRFLRHVTTTLERRGEAFSLSAYLEALERGHWLERPGAERLVAFLADAIERFPKLLRGENGVAGRALLDEWLRDPARRIPNDDEARAAWARIAAAMARPATADCAANVVAGG